MQMVQQITLPQTEDFYTKPYRFPVSLVAGACKNYTNPGPPPQPLPLSLDPAMQALLTSYGNIHEVSVADIAAAAVQFFRTAEGDTETLDHIELRFLLAYDFGRVLTCGSMSHHPERLGPATAQKSMRHGEAVKRTSEMFGYGLALHYVASALGVPLDWFMFILGSGARPDFLAHKSVDELVASNPTLETLGPSGNRVYVEVKARIGFGSMREENDTEGLLLNCAKKAVTCGDGILLSILIALPARSDSPGRVPYILVADPNNPPPLSRTEQVLFLLECYLFQAQRYGLDLMKLNVLRWMRRLGTDLTTWQQTEIARLEPRFAQVTSDTQPFLPRRTIGDREYQGRYFYTLIERLGKPRQRRLTIEQASAARNDGDLGTKYFAGVDTALMEIVARQDTDGLLTFGVRDSNSVDLTAKSAFREQQLELDDEDRTVVRQAAEQAISVWERTRIW